MRTSLVHRATRGPAPWWHSSTIFVPPQIMSERSMNEVEDSCRLAVSIGFDAALLSPAVSLFTTTTDALRALVDRGHAAGARVILRLPDRVFEGLGDPELDFDARRAAVLVLVRGAVEAGADGVDLHARADGLHGSAETVRTARGRFSELVRLVEAEAEAAGEAPLIVTAAIEGADAGELRSHLEEEWFHHLRWDALRDVAFESAALEEALVDSLDAHDRLGAVTAWAVPLPCAADAEGAARFLHAVSLPGALRAHGLFPIAEGGAGASQAQGDSAPESAVCPELTVMGRALEIRASAKLATGSLGIVEGLPWSREGVSVHLNGPVMVVLNSCAEPVAVPRTAALLVSSAPAETTDDGRTLVPPCACAWFEAPRVRPVAAQFWD
ncbi:hypothetical protein [Schaalia hyovaginalis]|uniref:hypothetical protein n=1 Tax=Schaalia hyovaginalis TaxID=29316 RepID=UPI002A754760|nr:hypothetical protein [Schaalia hyovaginalis]MDY2668765.1 hypothetical protein [Schaalia hyovaginalis]